MKTIIAMLMFCAVSSSAYAGDYILTRGMGQNDAATATLSNIEACITMAGELYGRWNGGTRYQCFDRDTGKMAAKIGCDTDQCKAWDRYDRLIAIVEIKRISKDTELKAIK